MAENGVRIGVLRGGRTLPDAFIAKVNSTARDDRGVRAPRRHQAQRAGALIG